MSETTSFDAGLIAAVASVLGIAYLFGAMLTFVSGGEEVFLLLAGSVAVTVLVGTLLSLTAGLLAMGSRFGRYVGTTAYGAVVLFGWPDLAAPDGVQLAAVVVSAVLLAYMLLRNPVPEPETSDIDESTSATRLGSTLR